MPINEADTCRTYMLPKLYSAGWEDNQISEQKSFTDGRIVLVGDRAIRRQQKRADYLLRYRRDFPIAEVEAKAAHRTAGDGLQQAKEYAQILGLKFAYATSGHTVIEHDFLTDLDNELERFPTPSELRTRLKTAQNISEDVGEHLLTPYYLRGAKISSIMLPSGKCDAMRRAGGLGSSFMRACRDRAEARPNGQRALAEGSMRNTD
jgi:type I restriction enzyme, R subunit